MLRKLQEAFTMTNKGVRVVKHAPSGYEHQQGMTCGETNVRTIVDGFGVVFQPLANPPLRVKLFGFSFVKDIQSLFKLNGLSAPIRHASKLDDRAKLKTIQEHIDRDEPVLVAIGNGHIKRGKFSPLARLFLGHFITIYGYNVECQIFYIYDSWLEGVFDGEIPIGNEVRTFAQFLWDWKGTLYYGFIDMDHIYLPVSIN
jgi:hypothetical protein